MFSNFESAEFENIAEVKLEPRLSEYLKKKKHHKEHNINDDLIEKEYNISKRDIEKIKMYFESKKNKKKMFDNTNTYHTDYVDTQGQKFPSMTEQKDKRLKRIEDKQRRDREANQQRQNYDIISRGFDMYRDDRKFASAGGNDFKSRFDPEVWFENSRDQNELESDDENPNVSQVTDMRRRYANTHVYKNEPPKIRYKDYMTRGCNEGLSQNNPGEPYSLDSIIGNLQSYKQNTYRTYDQKNAIDTVTGTVVPHNGCNDKRDMENNYKPMPYMNGSSLRDVDVENHLAYGTGQVRAKKSRGYPNWVEHQFQYISNDIQKPEHSVWDPGMPTRMHNKDVARKYQGREVMM
jgi:hypothetical protein